MHPNHQTYDDSELGSHPQQAGGQRRSLRVKDAVVTGGSRMLPPQNAFLWHGEYFRLIVSKKQKIQAGLFELAPLTAERNLKDCPGWALSAELSTKNKGAGREDQSPPCVPLSPGGRWPANIGFVIFM